MVPYAIIPILSRAVFKGRHGGATAGGFIVIVVGEVDARCSSREVRDDVVLDWMMEKIWGLIGYDTPTRPNLAPCLSRRKCTKP